jgi:ribonucleoside-diphosphate reductase alpha chain
LYALAYRRRILDDRVFVHVNERFEAQARAAGVWDAIAARVLERGRVRDDPSVPDPLRRVFPTAGDIGPAWHVRTQAAFQEHVDNAVSKTVNLSERATPTDVRATFEMAYSHGCKGITVYRQGSRAAQVLSTLGGRSGACPDCGVELEFAEGSSLCRICGFTHGT